MEGEMTEKVREGMSDEEKDTARGMMMCMDKDAEEMDEEKCKKRMMMVKKMMDKKDCMCKERKKDMCTCMKDDMKDKENEDMRKMGKEDMTKEEMDMDMDMDMYVDEETMKGKIDEEGMMG